jgi:urease accessory protein
LRRGYSSLDFARRGDRTVLVRSHAELPIVVQRPLRGPAGQALLVLLTPAGALFDGDALRLDVCCGEDTDITLGTAAATKLNRCDRGQITFDMQVRVGRGASFRYLPHELIPFRGASYRQRIGVDLREDAAAWLLDVVGPGASEAHFAYTRLEFETNVCRDGALVARERFGVTPASAAQLRERTHYGGLLVFGPGCDAAAARGMNERLAAAPPPAQAGASALPHQGVVLKMLGTTAESVRATLLASAACPAWLAGMLPA